MARVQITGIYLGRQGGEFPDKESGELIKWQRAHLWDPTNSEPLRLSVDRSVRAEFPEMIAPLAFGDPVVVDAELSSSAKGVSYRLVAIRKVTK